MKRSTIITLLLTACLGLSAQQYTELWATGTAVPGGAQRLEKVTDSEFRFAGRLKAGELRVSTTKKAGRNTRYLVPQLPDMNIVNHGQAYAESADATAACWQVTIDEDHYRFTVNTAESRLRGEIFQPWGELFVGGGATANGWAEGKMQLMKQSLDNPYVWTWEGELKTRPEFQEPSSFKFQGQDRWWLKSLHPVVADADILSDTRLRTGGPDTKWRLTQDGRYRITIDLFNETVKAEIIK